MSVVRWFDRQKVAGLIAVLAGAVGLWGVLSNPGSSCQDTPLRHVYHPARLQVVAKCQVVAFRVAEARREHDGDWHVNGVVQGGGWTNQGNDVGQHGLTVVEFVAGDPRPARFFAGQVLRLTVTKVYDQQHRRAGWATGWIEGHPVFAAKDVTPAARYKVVPPPAPRTDD